MTEAELIAKLEATPDSSKPMPKKPDDRMTASYAVAHGLRPRYRKLLGRLYWRVK